MEERGRGREEWLVAYQQPTRLIQPREAPSPDQRTGRTALLVPVPAGRVQMDDQHADDRLAPARGQRRPQGAAVVALNGDPPISTGPGRAIKGPPRPGRDVGPAGRRATAHDLRRRSVGRRPGSPGPFGVPQPADAEGQKALERPAGMKVSSRGAKGNSPAWAAP